MIIAHPAEGDYGTAKWGRKRKQEGAPSGWPDIGVYLPRHGYAGMFIELKKIGGAARPNQKEWLKKLRSAGYLAVLAYGIREPLELIRVYIEGGKEEWQRLEKEKLESLKMRRKSGSKLKKS